MHSTCSHICGPKCTKGCIPTAAERRLKLTLNKFKKITTDPSHLLSNLIPPQSQRSSRRIIPACTTARRISSFEISGALLFNNFYDSK